MPLPTEPVSKKFAVVARGELKIFEDIFEATSYCDKSLAGGVFYDFKEALVPVFRGNEDEARHVSLALEDEGVQAQMEPAKECWQVFARVHLPLSIYSLGA